MLLKQITDALDQAIISASQKSVSLPHNVGSAISTLLNFLFYKNVI